MCRLEHAQFRATSGVQQSFGATPQEALAALMTQLTETEAAPIIIWPYNRGDAYFTGAQQERLEDLRSRRDTLTPEECVEWEHLVEASLEASIARTQTLPLVKS